MSPSGAEVIRQIRSSIEEVDPSDVKATLSNGNGIVLLDVRESDEWDAGHIPGAKHIPRGYLESRVEGVVGSDRSQRVVIYCASGQRSALAANTLKELLGYEDVASMNGGITLWKDRGYDVEVPVVADQGAARALLAPPARAGDRARGPDEAAQREGAAARRRRARLADRALPRGGRRRHARASSTTTRSTSPTCSARSSTPTTGSARRRWTPRRSPSTAINPDVKVVKYQTRLDASNIMEIIEGYDVIVDGVDNFPTRYLLNDATVRLDIPVVSRLDPRASTGSLSVFAPHDGPCYRCLYPVPPPAELAPSCGANGVLGVLPGTMGLLQATEVVKLVVGAGEPLIGRLLLYEALGATFTELKVRRDPECPICSIDPSEITRRRDGRVPRLRGVLRRRGLG